MQGAQKQNLSPKSALHYSSHVTLNNNIIAQMTLTINIFLSIIDFVYLTKNFLHIVNACKWKTITVRTVHLLCKLTKSHMMLETNRWTAGCNTSQKHTRISIFKIFKAESGIQGHKNGKKNTWTYIFSFMKLLKISIMQSDTRDTATVFFKMEAIIIAVLGQNTLHWELNEVIHSGKCNCHFEAIN